MWFKFAATLLVATSCVNAQLRQDEVDQFTLNGGCRDLAGKIGAQLEISLSNGVVKITANHVPNHEWEIVNPNAPKAVPQNYTLVPPTMLPPGEEMCTNQGPIGIAKNGVFIFDPTAGGGGNAKTNEEMDKNGGHTTPFGEYHYHYLPNNKLVWDCDNPESQFIGVALDGYPIYSEGRGVDYSQLDVCRGMIINGRYTYIATQDYYPYFMGCFRAKPQVEGAVGSKSCSDMKKGQACTCSYGIKSATKKRQLLDLLRGIVREEKRQTNGGCWSKTPKQADQTFCGATESMNGGPFYMSFNRDTGLGPPGFGPPGFGPPGGFGGQNDGNGGQNGGYGGQNGGYGGQNAGSGGQNGGYGGQNAGSGGQNGGYGGQNGGYGGQSGGYGGQNGVSGTNNMFGGSNSQTGIYGIPNWLLNLMWLEWNLQRYNQYGNQYGYNNRGSYGYYSGKRGLSGSGLSNEDEQEKRQFTEYVEGMLNQFGGKDNLLKRLGSMNPFGNSDSNQGNQAGNQGNPINNQGNPSGNQGSSVGGNNPTGNQGNFLQGLLSQFRKRKLFNNNRNHM